MDGEKVGETVSAQQYVREAEKQLVRMFDGFGIGRRDVRRLAGRLSGDDDL